MKATSIWISKYRSVLDNGRGHSVVVDLPPENNGDDTGPTALELLPMALAGCITTIFSMVAEKRRLKYSGLRVDLEAEKGEKTIEEVKGVLTIKTGASRETVETVLRLTMEICPVGILFEKAGIKPKLEVKVEPE